MKHYLKRIFITAIIVIVTLAVQSIWSLNTSQSVPTPDFILIVVCLFGFMRGENYGAVTGLFAGMLVDAMYADNIGIYMFIYMILGFLSGIFRKYFYNDSILMPMLLLFVSDFAENSLFFVFRFLLRNQLNYPFFFENIIFPEMIITCFFTLILFKPLYFLNKNVLEGKKDDKLHYKDKIKNVNTQ